MKQTYLYKKILLFKSRYELRKGAQLIVMNSEFLTVEEVAYILQVSSQTIRKLIHENKLFAIRVGKNFRVPVEYIEKLKSNDGRRVLE